MKMKTSKKYAFTKIKSLPTKPTTSSRILTQRVTDQTKRTDFQVSFDSFFYQDHVTLKKYSMDHLKHLSVPKRQTYQEYGNQKWRQEQHIQMVKLIEYIELWKNIKSNRNNILVYGNKKNYTEIVPTQKKLTWNLDQQQEEQHSLIGSTELGTQRANTTDNLAITSRPSHFDTCASQQEHQVKQTPKPKQPDTTLHSQSVGKLKRKMNLQIYKLNKELLRDYLNQNKEYDQSFNYLIKDQDNLQSKLKKITTLISVLKKQRTFEENSILNRFSQNTLKNIQVPNLQEPDKKHDISHSHNPKSSKAFRVRTQITESQQGYSSRGEISLKRLKQTCKRIDGHEEVGQKRKINVPLLLKKKANTNFYRREQEESKIDKTFQKQWQNINEQIRLKFRREAQYSLNMRKKKTTLQTMVSQ